MKKKRTIIRILLMTMIISLNIYNVSFKRIRFSDKYFKNDDYKIRVADASLNWIEVEDRDEKEKVIEYMDSTKYLYAFNLKPGGDTPTGGISIVYKDGEYYDKFIFYGIKVVHRTNDEEYWEEYWLTDNQFDKLQKLYNDLKKRSK
ncbi:hypothetical protein [Clostridium algidicarnis]|uniref:hypothetical protein n=1 Tax=Clostridium algidicarnis TaxID=37659 RepID=UPI003FD8AAB3